MIGEFAIHRNIALLDNWSIGSAYLEVAWQEKQPEILEFAVTTIGMEEDHLGQVCINLGLMLIESCDNSALKTYMRVLGARAIIDQQSWTKVKPQQRFLALE